MLFTIKIILIVCSIGNTITLLPYEAKSEMRSARCDGIRQRNTEREDEERVRRRLTVAGSRGTRGEEGSTQEARGGGARHQPGAVLGEEEDGSVRRSIAREGRSAHRRPSRGLEQRSNCRRAITPRRRCPTTTLPTATNAHHCRTVNTLKGPKRTSFESTPRKDKFARIVCAAP